MKHLLVLRHAKSSWKQPDLQDHQRPLNGRGRRDAPNIGQWLAQQDLVPDEVFSSTAVRAATTAKLVAESCGCGAPVFTDDLYLAPPETYLHLVRQQADEASRRVMVVGHNPGIESLVSLLTESSTVMPTCALAVITLPIDSWRRLATPSAVN